MPSKRGTTRHVSSSRPPFILDAILEATQEREKVKEQAEERQQALKQTILKIQEDIDAYTELEECFLDVLKNSPVLHAEPGHTRTAEDIEAAKEAHGRLTFIRIKKTDAIRQT